MARIRFPLIQAVLEGRQPGTVHVDKEESPRVVFIANRQGFSQVCGDVDNAAAADMVMEAIDADPLLRGRYLLWYDPPSPYRERMERLSDDVVQKRTRIRFSLSQKKFKESIDDVDKEEGRVEIVPVDKAVLREASVFNLELGKRFWPTDESFVENAYGVVVRCDGKPASLCYAACVAGGVAEIDVATLEEFRGRGLARIATSAFIDRCLQAGIDPSWDCFDYNAPSIRLARSLGFEEQITYPFFSINT